jgi:hypothetical protein
LGGVNATGIGWIVTSGFAGSSTPSGRVTGPSSVTSTTRGAAVSAWYADSVITSSYNNQTNSETKLQNNFTLNVVKSLLLVGL